MKRFLFLIWFLSSIYFAQVSVNPTRPSAADNAFTTAKGFSEIEFGFSSTNNNWTLPLLLKLGISNDFEFGFSMNGLVNSKNSTELGNPGIQLKYRILEKTKLSIAVVAKTEFVKNSDPKFTFYAAPSFVISTFQIDGTFGTYIYDDGIGYNSSFIHAVSFSQSLNNRFGIFVEIFGEMTTNYNPIFIDGGLSYKFGNTFVVDGGVSLGLNDDAGNDITIQVGFTSLLLQLF